MLPWALLALVLASVSPTSAVDENPSTNTQSLLWGPYRPNIYLGLRPRVPKSVIAGLMWARLEDVRTTLRHNVNQSEDIARYGWTAYDTREGGQQVIEDVDNKVNITTEFIKYSEGQHQGNWGLRIKGMPRFDAPPELKTTVIFYLGIEEKEACTHCRLDARQQLGEGEDTSIHAVNMNLVHPKLGASRIHIPIPINSDGHREIVFVKSLNVTEDRLWQAKSTFLDTLKDQTKDQKEPEPTDIVIHNAPGAGNLHFVQMVLHGEFEFDILYSTETAKRTMTSASLTTDLEKAMQTFSKNFLSVFNPTPPFKTFEHLSFSKSVFSDLLGGLGYFTGSSKVVTAKKAIYAETTANFWEKSADANKHTTPETKGPYELLTHTPSRATFPRGSLFDEGFHLLIVLEWDADLALEVMRDWLFLMDDDGWIAREQILGSEASASTTPESINQFPHIASPPTMYLVISKFVKMLRGTIKYHGRPSVYLSKPETGKALVIKMQSLLKRHYEWFRKSQSGDVEAHSIPSANLNEGYRWRARTPGKNMASGLSDYPRAEPPDLTELHLDALCWVGVMGRTLEQIAFFTENAHDAFTYQKHVRSIKGNIDTLHWDASTSLYCDSVVRNAKHTLTCHKGYLSLFPFLTGLLDPSHPHLPAVLDFLRDPTHLWSQQGIRSLSPQDPAYATEENYARSSIWVNFNYLLLDQLLRLAQTKGPEQARARDTYTSLRKNVVKTVFKAYRDTGFVWEQYDSASGKGVRAQGGTGCSALVVLMMRMPDLESLQGVGGQVKGYVEEVRKQAVSNPRVDAEGVVLVLGVMVFVYVTRRRFVGTLRGLRRN
ncbi:glycoside hydrolase [Bipolaris maydis]|nr:glycoside hydrolase [Bipolaris maydis]